MNIYQRVRATVAKQDAKRAKAEQAPINRRLGALRAAEMRRERRIEALRNGTATPRNAREDAIQCEQLEFLGIDY